ncbi:hypothetical protein SNEBB_004755 [Seison nebaliae]|nr:hypothetical protein SNEBB_004755 [Seison nebaliae]
MKISYYDTLQVNRDASDAELKRAYRKLALQWHPMKHEDSDESKSKFYEICEAYEILINALTRGTYDQYGEEGLRNGVPIGDQDWSKGYIYHGDWKKTFANFFGTDNPYAEYFARAETDKTLAFGGINGMGRRRQPPPLERYLYLTLEEVYLGCIKKMKILRNVMNDDGHTSRTREKILTIEVKRGWLPNTKVVFPKDGDQEPNIIPADVVFLIRDKPHDLFHREGVNLIYPRTVTLLEALTGLMVSIPTLDGRRLDIRMTDIIHPNYSKKIPNEGMPYVDETEKRGDLIITFEIEYPKKLSLKKRSLVPMILSRTNKRINGIVD